MVGRLGFEPRTNGLKARCSTSCANDPKKDFLTARIVDMPFILNNPDSTMRVDFKSSINEFVFIGSLPSIWRLAQQQSYLGIPAAPDPDILKPIGCHPRRNKPHLVYTLHRVLSGDLDIS